MDDRSFMTQVEVLSVTDSGRRRRWSTAEKVRIVEESLSHPRMIALAGGVVGLLHVGYPFGDRCSACRLPAEARASAAESALPAVKDELSQVQALVSASEERIRHLRLQIAKLRRELYGHGAERHARLVEQLEMQLEDLETDLEEDRAKADAAPANTTVASVERRHPAHKPFPEHLPRERVVVEAPTSCTCCGSARIVNMGENVTETLEVIPRQWKVIQTVREKFTCRDCEKISQTPAPFHPTPRGWAGTNLLAMVLFEKFGQHQPLNRQDAKEGVEISLSTLADRVGACAGALQPIHDLIHTHILGADDTTVPLMAKGGTQTARLWTYVRDDRSLAGGAPPAALHDFSTDRRMEHPTWHLAGWTGTLQANAYGGYNGVRSGPQACTGVPCAMLVARQTQVLRTGGFQGRRPEGQKR